MRGGLRVGFPFLGGMTQKMLSLMMKTMLVASAAANSSHVCGSEGNNALTQPLGYVKSESSTCAVMVAKVFRESNNDFECKQKQNQHKTCCDGTKLANAPPKRQPPPRVSHTGPNPVCDLCRGGTHPSEPSHTIHLLHIGASSCKNCYVAGKQGKMPAHLCDPLRCFARDPFHCPAFVSGAPTKSSNSNGSALLSLGTATVALIASVTMMLSITMAKALF